MLCIAGSSIFLWPLWLFQSSTDSIASYPLTKKLLYTLRGRVCYCRCQSGQVHAKVRGKQLHSAPMHQHFWVQNEYPFADTDWSRWFPRKRYVNDAGGGIRICCPPEMVVVRRPNWLIRRARQLSAGGFLSNWCGCVFWAMAWCFIPCTISNFPFFCECRKSNKTPWTAVWSWSWSPGRLFWATSTPWGHFARGRPKWL